MRVRYAFCILAISIASTALWSQTHSHNSSGAITAVQPSIVVSDLNFGTSPVGLPALTSKTFHITNRGNASLSVRSQSGLVPSTMSAVFDISDVTGTSFPLLIDDVNSGFNVHSFTVKFTPNKVGVFDATITFKSNAGGIDSVCRLHGVGITPGIGVNAVDFGRRRIGDTIETDVDGGAAQIMVNNTLGGTNSTVVKATASGDVGEFLFDDLSQFTGMTMAPAQQVIRAIRFRPTKAKYDTLRITFEVSTGSPVVFQAVGTGVIPHIAVNDLNFGTVDLKSGTTSASQKLQIVNLDVNTTPSWLFYDDVTIDDVTVLGAGTEIGLTSSSDVGTQGFAFDKAKMDLSLVLPAGLSSNTFEAWYKPTKPGTHSAQLKIVCNAATQPVSTWTGVATGDVNEVESDDEMVRLHPNPTNELLTLHFADAADRSITIVNALGERLGAGYRTSGTEMQLDVHSFAAGLYTIQVSSGRTTLTRSFIKY